MRTRTGWGSLLLLGVTGMAGIGLAGCAEKVGPLTESAIAASLQAVNRGANQEQIEKLLTSEAVVRSTRKLTQAVVDASLADLDSPERQARAKQLAADFVRDLGPTLGAVFDQELLPRIEKEIAASVQIVLDQALSEANRQRVGSFTTALARQALDAVGPQIERAISHGVSAGVEKSLRTVLTRDLGPALAKALGDNAPAISQAARAATAGALAGVNDAMNGPFGEMLRRERKASIQEAADAAAAERKALFDKLDQEIADSRRWFRALVVMAAVGGALLLGLGFLLWRLLAENRRLQSGV